MSRKVAQQPARDETVTLSEAKALIAALAAEESVLLLSAPGLGKSDVIRAAAAEAGLPCRSLLGTQIAPEDVSGVPRIEGERAVFCPPRVLLPERPEPFCLFLDELPAASPDVQKAFYALLLERRIGEHELPKGSWVVAAGNRAEDRALVRTISSALVNRVLLLHVRADVAEWLAWGRRAGVRADILAFIAAAPEALMRPVPAEPAPFSTPRAWASHSKSLTLAAAAGRGDEATRRALAFGKVSPGDAALFCALDEAEIADLKPGRAYVADPALLPGGAAPRWFVLRRIREDAERGRLDGLAPQAVDAFLTAIPSEARFTLLVGLVAVWAELGADESLLEALREATGL
ncbi:MAG: ATP-binding protein [Pseudomonadota bacterium]